MVRSVGSMDENMAFRQSRKGSPGQTWTQGAAEQCLTCTRDQALPDQQTKILSLKGSEGQGQIREKREEIKQLATREQKTDWDEV